MANRAERRAKARAQKANPVVQTQPSVQDDPYEAGKYDAVDLGCVNCEEDGCDAYARGWCRTCAGDTWDFKVMCLSCLSVHCHKHQHVAWVSSLKNLHGYMEDQQVFLYDLIDPIAEIHRDVHGLDSLRAHGLLSFPKRDASVLAEIEESRDVLAHNGAIAFEECQRIGYRIGSNHQCSQDEVADDGRSE